MDPSGGYALLVALPWAEVSPFWADIAAKVAAAAALGILTHLYKRGMALVAEHARMRKALIVLLDERRRELWDKIDSTSSSNDAEQYAKFSTLMARKDRIDRVRDVEWRAAGCPREPLRRGME